MVPQEFESGITGSDGVPSDVPIRPATASIHARRSSARRRARVSDPTLWLVIAGAGVYSAVWSTISVLRIYAFRASVYDLGAFAQSGWRVYSTSLSIRDVLLTLFNTGGILFFAPVSLGGYGFIVAFQSVALGTGAIFTYLIARRNSLGSYQGAALSIAYLLYFPLAGLNFTDAHYEAFLVPLFLCGFWLFLRGNYRWSFPCFLIAGALWYPMAVFPALFGFQLSASRTAERFVQRFDSPLRSPARTRRGVRSVSSLMRWVAGWKVDSLRTPVPNWYSFGILGSALVLLLGGFFTNALYYPLNDAVTLAHATVLSPTASLDLKALTFVLILAPLAFLPLLSPRWLVYSSPFLFLMFFANYFGYIYPGIVTDWHGFLFVPFFILAAVDGLSRLTTQRTWVHQLMHHLGRWGLRLPSRRTRVVAGFRPAARSLNSRRNWRAMRNPANAEAMAVVVASVAAALFLCPYGPWNAATSASFYAGDLFDSNQTLFRHFMSLAALIPPNDPAVIIQDNMPELLPRPLPPGSLSPLVAGPFGQVAYNLTWPNPDGRWTPINADYVIGNPVPLRYSFFGTEGPYPFNISMEQILFELYEFGAYGIVGEADGMWVIEHHYAGPIQYYVPYAATFAPASFTTANGTRNGPACHIPCIETGPGSPSSLAWYGPYTYLAPGHYDVRFHIALVNWTSGETSTLEVSANNGQLPLGAIVVRAPTNGSAYVSEVLTVPVFAANGFGGVEFRATTPNYGGDLILFGVGVVETSPPPVVG